MPPDFNESVGVLITNKKTGVESEKYLNRLAQIRQKNFLQIDHDEQVDSRNMIYLLSKSI